MSLQREIYIQENRYEEVKLWFIIVKSLEKKSNKENRFWVDKYLVNLPILTRLAYLLEILK